MFFTGDFFSDSALMTEYLDEIPLYTGTERNGQKFFNRPKGKAKPESTKYGWTWRKRLTDTTERTWDEGVGLYRTKIMDDYPHLYDLFKEYSEHHFPYFIWTQVQINLLPQGTSIRCHLDKKNVGDSMLVAFGDYKGGSAYIICDDEEKHYTDPRNSPQKFNGAKVRHGVDEVLTGTRYSLVFYNDILKRMKRY